MINSKAENDIEFLCEVNNFTEREEENIMADIDSSTFLAITTEVGVNKIIDYLMRHSSECYINPYKLNNNRTLLCISTPNTELIEPCHSIADEHYV